jgi:hypothetical protein
MDQQISRLCRPTPIMLVTTTKNITAWIIKELTYIVYTVNQSKHRKIKEGRDEIWHIPCELITWFKAIAECQVKNSHFLGTNIWEPNLKSSPNQITRTRMDTTCTKTRLQASLHNNCYNLNMKREGNEWVKYMVSMIIRFTCNLLLNPNG